MPGITFLPSPLDRLDPVARLVRWWTQQLLDVFGRGRRTVLPAQTLASGATEKLPTSIVVELSNADGFVALTHLPKGSASAHQRALSLRIADLSPLQPGQLVIAASAIEQDPEGGTTYAAVMARREQLDQLEKLARSRKASSVIFNVPGYPGIDLKSPRAQRYDRIGRIVDAGLVIGIGAAAALAAVAWSNRINDETEALVQREASLRRLATAAEVSTNDALVSRDLVDRGLFKRRGTAALDALANLNAATPDNTWWTKVIWMPDQLAVTAQSLNATSAITGLSAANKAWSVEMSGPLVAATDGGVQTFDFLARRRGE